MLRLPKANLIIASQVLVEPTGTLFWRPLDVLLFRRARNIFSASQSGKYSVTLHFRSREVRFPVQCQKFLVEFGKNVVEYGKNVRIPLIYSFHSYFKIKVSIRYFNLV
jgi:hypothetical protein